MPRRPSIRRSWAAPCGLAVFIMLALAGCGAPLSLTSQAALPPPSGALTVTPAATFTGAPSSRLPFNVADPTPTPIDNPAILVHGLFMTPYFQGSPNQLDEVLGLYKGTNLNAVVITIKNSYGQVLYPSNVPDVTVAPPGPNRIPDIRGLIATLHGHGIYVIGRIVTFQDPGLAAHRPDLAIRTTSGGVWRNNLGLGWVDPYSADVWNYDIAIAKEAVGLGFNEIQYDYVRFPTDGPLSVAVYPHKDGRTKEQVIAGFLSAAHAALHPLGAYLSADLFGLTTYTDDDYGIGQNMRMDAPYLDYVSPMVYPSLYSPGSFGLPNPDLAPYQTVHQSLVDALPRLAGTHCQLRPWLQDYSLPDPYGVPQVRQEMQAAQDAGVKQWIFWNSAGGYNWGAYTG